VEPEAIAVKKSLLLDDSEFTKEEINAFEKKDWIGIKDLIFDTEPRILEHLSKHCYRWR